MRYRGGGVGHRSTRACDVVLRQDTVQVDLESEDESLLQDREVADGAGDEESDDSGRNLEGDEDDDEAIEGDPENERSVAEGGTVTGGAEGAVTTGGAEGDDDERGIDEEVGGAGDSDQEEPLERVYEANIYEGPDREDSEGNGSARMYGIELDLAHLRPYATLYSYTCAYIYVPLLE